MKFACLALLFLSSNFEAEALNMRHRHHGDDGKKVLEEGDVTTAADDGDVHDPNPWCDLCAAVDGVVREMDHVPEQREDELVDTVVSGMMPCGALEYAGHQHVFTEDVCTTLQTNAGSTCCSHVPPPEEPDCSCYSDDDCVPIAWCRPMDDDPNGMKNCVEYLKEGDICTGYAPIHMQTKCGESLVCSPSDEDIAFNIVDAPGTCVKVCSSDDDCAHDAWCRTIHDDPIGHCFPYRKDGEACSEFAMVGLETKCDPSLLCTLPYGIADAPGTCELPYEDSDDGKKEIDGGRDAYGCSTGAVWCPELEEYIQPWMTNCPFDGMEIDGGLEMLCTDGRCNDIPDGCGIVHYTWYDFEFLPGTYTYNMNGHYSMPKGCSAVCQGCGIYHVDGYAPDEYNCNRAVGMTWCPELEECVLPGETNCSEDVSSPPAGGPGSSCASDSDCTPNAWCRPMDYDFNGMKQCVLYLKEEDSCFGYGPIHLHTKCDPSLVCTPLYSTNLEAGGICSATQPLASSKNVASSSGSAATTRSYPLCVNHEVVVDCDHPEATDTDTPNPVEVVLLQAPYYEVASTKITGFCQRDESNQYVETIRFDNLCENADGVDLYIDGHDAIFIDRVRLFRDGQLVRSWGSNNGLGWCLSEDPNDYNQGPKDWSDLLGKPFGVTCVRSMFFEYDGNIASGDFINFGS